MRYLLASSIAALALAASTPSFASDAPAWQPNSMFVQAGSGTHVESAALGMTWDWRWRYDYVIGTVTGYTEVDVGRWRTLGRADDDGFTQFGISPVLRLYPTGPEHTWFAEAGIGADWISPKYHNGSREFSTTFNFGDRITVGRRFGPNQAHEISLGVEHFSNCGADKPNPGENFVQLRYSAHF